MPSSTSAAAPWLLLWPPPCPPLRSSPPSFLSAVLGFWCWLRREQGGRRRNAAPGRGGSSFMQMQRWADGTRQGLLRVVFYHYASSPFSILEAGVVLLAGSSCLFEIEPIVWASESKTLDHRWRVGHRMGRTARPTHTTPRLVQCRRVGWDMLCGSKSNKRRRRKHHIINLIYIKQTKEMVQKDRLKKSLNPERVLLWAGGLCWPDFINFD